MRITDYVLRLRPWSPAAFLAAVLITALAASIQELFALLGVKLYFATFCPAILITSVLAGRPAGIFATLVTTPFVCWAFMPPHFEFTPPTPEQYRSIILFLLSSALAIAFASLYREALILFREK